MADFIVAIELGSSKITGIAGKKNLDGSIRVLAVVKEDATSCIRKGVVNNIDKTVQALGNVIKKLENSLKTKIARVYVGVNGQSIRSEKNIIVKQLPADTKVTVDMVNGLMDANRSMQYPDQEILDAVTQEYKVDNQLQVDPAGFICSRLTGISAGYLMNVTVSGESTLTPVWHIGTDTGDLYINAVNGRAESIDT